MNSWSGGTNFTNLPSWESSFNYQPSESVFSSSSSSSGGGMDPLTAGLGALGAGFGFLGGLGQNQTAASIAGAQLKAADAARRDAILLGREQFKGQLAENIAGRWATLGWGPDLEQGRQFRAMGQMLGPFAEKETAVMSERSKRERLAEISPERQKALRFENELNRRNAIAAQVASGAAMFGPTSFSKSFTG